MGVMVWPMVEFEADDALASAAAKASQDEHVGQVLICTPDKDLRSIGGWHASCATGSQARDHDVMKQELKLSSE